MSRPDKPDRRVLSSNKKARHDYLIEETFEAGIQLTGTEVKSAREGRVQLKDSYVEFREGEAWLVGTHISAYSHGNRQNHPLERPRKLLLQKREIERLFGQSQTKGLTIVPLQMYLKGPWIKVEIALGRGKKLFDKRETERRKEQEKEMREAVSRARRMEGG